MPLQLGSEKKFLQIVTVILLGGVALTWLPAQSPQSTASSTSSMPHGGQASAGSGYLFEVVYRPKETRIYVYDSSGRPATTRALSGQVLMQVRGNPRPVRFPVRYVPASQASQQDYLRVAADVSRVPDGQMQVTFRLTNLPRAPRATVQFAQRFALTPKPSRVAIVEWTEAERTAIAKQGLCPVTGVRLGEHGRPIKLSIDQEQSIFVCCKGCIGKVQEDPDRYTQKSSPRPSRPAKR